MFSLPLNISEEVTIDKPVNDVFKLCADFNQTPKWSPWLYMEQSAKTSNHGTPMQVGHSQDWEGNVIGSGKMTITALQKNERIDYDLQFLKPFKSHATVSQTFSEKNGKTTVVWSMKSSLPFFLFFICKMMKVYMSADFKRGLDMLKALAETGKVPTYIAPKGVVESKGFRFIGITRECATNDVGPLMQQDFQKLETFSIPQPKFAFSIYHQYDLVKQKCKYTSGVAYDKPVQIEGLESGNIPAHQALQIDHFGSYLYLGNAWMSLFSHQRAKKLKIKKSIPMYEIYRTMPGQVEDAKVHTELYLPVK